MLKIQYGIAGFFAGAFGGLLIALLEMRIIDQSKYPVRLFIAIALTVISCGIAGLIKALRIAEKKMRS